MSYMKSVALMMFAVVASCTAEAAHTIQHDLDRDGVPDLVNIGPVVSDDDSMIEREISIEFTAGGAAIAGRLESDTGHLAVYPGRVGEMIVDRSNRNSRDSAELSYDVYRWNDGKNTLCLHSQVFGSPANQLRGELVPGDIDIKLFGGCSAPGSNTLAPAAPVVPFVGGDVRLRELGGVELPEWVAAELAVRASDSAAEELLMLASDQSRRRSYRASALILRGMIKKSIRLEETCSALEDVYKGAGYAEPRDDCGHCPGAPIP